MLPAATDRRQTSQSFKDKPRSSTTRESEKILKRHKQKESLKGIVRENPERKKKAGDNLEKKGGKKRKKGRRTTSQGQDARESLKGIVSALRQP